MGLQGEFVVQGHYSLVIITTRNESQLHFLTLLIIHIFIIIIIRYHGARVRVQSTRHSTRLQRTSKCYSSPSPACI